MHFHGRDILFVKETLLSYIPLLIPFYLGPLSVKTWPALFFYIFYINCARA